MVYGFTLTIEGADVLGDEALDALYEAGCGDATFGASNGVQTADFDREATDFADAVWSAIKAVETAVPGARVIDIHRDPRRRRDGLSVGLRARRGLTTARGGQRQDKSRYEEPLVAAPIADRRGWLPGFDCALSCAGGAPFRCLRS